MNTLKTMVKGRWARWMVCLAAVTMAAATNMGCTPEEQDAFATGFQIGYNGLDLSPSFGW